MAEVSQSGFKEERKSSRNMELVDFTRLLTRHKKGA
jgi:hypothetical protein